MIYDDCTLEELRAYMKQNSDQQDELERSIERLHDGEDDYMRMFQEDRKAMELLHFGWMGEDAEKFILQSVEDTEMLQKQIQQAFSQEKDRLKEELQRLQIEEQDISDVINNKQE